MEFDELKIQLVAQIRVYGYFKLTWPFDWPFGWQDFSLDLNGSCD
jgi:hypothetical protein